ncbi:MAG TPA: NAD(P)-dependent oxidoreductase [Pirellulales bacterium]|jgi:3-hydroxyisobutyrate dehydrogenase-like beta-hydroxyacid dehydrogenase
MNDKQITIIGLGLLGGAIAARLGEQGWQVRGYDVDPTRLEAAAAAGAQAADTVTAACEGARRVLLSLPNSDVVASVVEELRSRFTPNLILLDTTTGDPDFAEKCSADLRLANVAYLEANVVGSSAQARTGDVTLLVAGSGVAIEDCKNLFSALARQWFAVGPSGSAARMKLVVNLVLGLHRAALAEGLNFAEKLGLAPKLTLEVLRAGAAYSRAMDAKGQKMIDRDYEPQARLAQHSKDVGLILAAGSKAGVSLPLSRLHQRLLEDSIEAGRGELDNSAIIEIFRHGTR